MFLFDHRDSLLSIQFRCSHTSTTSFLYTNYCYGTHMSVFLFPFYPPTLSLSHESPLAAAPVGTAELGRGPR